MVSHTFETRECVGHPAKEEIQRVFDEYHDEKAGELDANDFVAIDTYIDCSEQN